MSVFDDVYARYAAPNYGPDSVERRAEIMQAREDLISESRTDMLEEALHNPDFHPETMRNGIVQPFILTRGGEQYTYNVICMPGDKLYAGDIIDAFGEKWIVVEARADATTHQTGIMHQCNKKLAFQNFNSTVVERWCWIDTSGYSSSINKDVKLHFSSEQMAIYLPFDTDTEKIFTDKRLAINKSYDRSGKQILSCVSVTSTNPVSESFNNGDHLLMLKVKVDLYNPETDNYELEICDYTALADEENSPAIQPSIPSSGISLTITGRPSVRIGRSITLNAVFTDTDGNDVSVDNNAAWNVVAESGIATSIDGNMLTITTAKDSALIGAVIQVTASDANDVIAAATAVVEVIGIV